MAEDEIWLLEKTVTFWHKQNWIILIISINLFNKYYSAAEYIPGSVLSSGITIMKKKKEKQTSKILSL